MSIDKLLLPPVPFTDLFDGRLTRFGVTERIGRETTRRKRCLTDGHGWWWFYACDNGSALPVGGISIGSLRQVLYDVFGARVVWEGTPG